MKLNLITTGKLGDEQDAQTYRNSQHKTSSVSHNASDFQVLVSVVHQTRSPSEVDHLGNTYNCNSGVPVAVGERYFEYEILYRLGSSECPCLPDVGHQFVMKGSAFPDTT